MRSRSTGTGGLLLALASAASFATSGVLASSLLGAGWTPGAAVTLRIAGAAVLLTPLAVAQLRGRWAALWSARWRVVAFGVFAVAGCQFGYFSAVQTTPVSLALLVEYSGVILVVAWVWAVGGQRPRLPTAVGGLAALGGLALVLRVVSAFRGGGTVSATGMAWAALAAACLAVYFVIAAHDDGGVSALATAWAGMVLAAVALALAGLVGVLPMAASTRAVELAGSRPPWWVAMGVLVLVGTAFPYATGMAAARVLGASVASFLALTEVLFAAAWAWMALGQSLRDTQLLGGALVLAGVALVQVDAGRPRHRQRDLGVSEPVGRSS